MSETSAADPHPAAAPLEPEVTRAVAEAVDRRMNQTIETLKDLVTIPGIAWDSFDREPLERSAVTVAELMRGLGLDDVQILTADRPAMLDQPVGTPGAVRPGGPAVVGRRPAAPGKPTVLLYAHHDVQPTGDLALWDTEPFTAVERDGRLYGRGAADDKAGIMVHLAALQAVLDAGADTGFDTGIGVTFFIEGEEEAGSPTFRAFLEAHRDRLAADVIVVADSGNWRVGVPALTTSLRGLVDGVLGVRVLEHAVHSGMYGGPVLDAPTLLARLIATLHDAEGNVAIPGLEPTAAASSRSPEYPEDDFRADASVLDSVRLAGSGPLADRLWNRPALSIIGTDVPQIEVSSNTLQPVARAKFSLRLGPGMDPQSALEAVRAHVEAQELFGAEVFFEPGETGRPFRTDTSAPAARAMLASLEEAWRVEPVEIGVGGSIPFTADLTEVFPEASLLITGVEDPDSRAHSANESLHLGDFRNAVLAEALLLVRLGRDTDSAGRDWK